MQTFMDTSVTEEKNVVNLPIYYPFLYVKTTVTLFVGKVTYKKWVIFLASMTSLPVLWKPRNLLFWSWLWHHRDYYGIQKIYYESWWGPEPIFNPQSRFRGPNTFLQTIQGSLIWSFFDLTILIILKSIIMYKNVL